MISKHPIPHNCSAYRFGFNGHEKDDEVHGVTGSWLSFGDYGYDTRIGRRPSPDPILKVHESPYAAFANNPIWFIDPTGRDTLEFDKDGNYLGDEMRIEAEGRHVGRVAGENGYLFNFVDNNWANQFTTDEFPTSTELGGDGKLFNSVTLVPNKVIENTLEKSGVNDFLIQAINYYFAYTESRGVKKKMDYVTSPETKELMKGKDYSLLITDVDGVKLAHDVYNYGNFLWGAGMSRLRIPYAPAVIGAHIDNMIHHNGEFDSKDDQLSIFIGFIWGKIN